MENRITQNSLGESRDGWISDNPLFRSLTVKEVLEFQQWAYDNYDKEKGKTSDLWHPVIRAEFAKIKDHREQNK